jgi:hypothetical protein
MRFDFLKRSTHAGKDQAAQRSPACLAKPSRARHDIAQYQSARVFTPEALIRTIEIQREGGNRVIGH